MAVASCLLGGLHTAACCLDAQLLLASVIAPAAEPEPETDEAAEGEEAAGEGETPAEGEAAEGDSDAARTIKAGRHSVGRQSWRRRHASP